MRTGTGELDAAGIHEQRLREDYLACRSLHAHHGRTYYTATRVLPPARRPAIHALYGFARWVDDIVDEPEAGTTAEEQTHQLSCIEDDLQRALAGGAAHEQVLRAVAHTAQEYAIPAEYFTAFMSSMRMDLTRTSYTDLDDLRGYMFGSAAVIGLKVLPVLGTVVPRTEAEPHAAALGEAFQLTNFIRDVAEDLRRGRVYLPQAVLDSHGVDRHRLEHCARTGTNDPLVRAAMADLVEMNQDFYRRAEPGIAMLDPVARPCVATAFRLYRAVLDKIVVADHDVWTRRHRVAETRKIAAAAPALAQSLWARIVPRPASF